MSSVSRCFLISALWFGTAALAQDTSTGAIRGTVGDSAGARVGASSVVLVNAATNFRYSTTTDSFGRFAFELLRPGDYSPAPSRRECRRRPRLACMWMWAAPLRWSSNWRSREPKKPSPFQASRRWSKAQPSGLSSLIDEPAINELPLNGRRYTDLALLTPGVTQDPRGLTSGSNGDLAPNPLVSCPVTSTNCQLPTGLAQLEPADVSAFSHNFKTPRVQQASLNIEREVAHRTSVGVSYMYVHGVDLIRARDVNLPPPVNVSYPVYDALGVNFLGAYYDVDSFSTVQTTRTLTCPFPPCINPLARPIPQLGSINVFESAASSVYHGATISIRRRMTSGVYFMVSYTFAHAIDDGQDALVAGQPASVQNSYAPNAEKGPSVTDQRQRFVLSCVVAPKPFHRDHEWLGLFFNNWKASGVVTVGSGKPISATVTADPNQDGNSSNDRLPGEARDSLLGPDYATTDVRLTRRIYAGDRVKLELMAESFNLLNRDNKRVQITQDGFISNAAQFVQTDKAIGINIFPAQYRVPSSFLHATDAYAPRQIQLALKLLF